MELVTSVIGSNASRDGAAMSIALRLQGSDTLAQGLRVLHAMRHISTSKHTDLDFGHNKPTPMFRRVAELDAPQNPPRLGWRKGFRQRGGDMHVQVNLDDANVFGLRIDPNDQSLNTGSKANLGTMLGHLHMAPACQRLDLEKQIGGSQAFILVINPLCLVPSAEGAAQRPQERQAFLQSRQLGSEDRTPARRDQVRPPSPPQTPLLRLGCTSVRVARAWVHFLSNWRMVSSELNSTKPSSKALPGCRRSVQWSWPVDTWLSRWRSDGRPVHRSRPGDIAFGACRAALPPICLPDTIAAREWWYCD